MTQVQRRQMLIAAGALLVAPGAVLAQQEQKLRRIGALLNDAAGPTAQAFERGLRELARLVVDGKVVGEMVSNILVGQA